MERSLYRVVLAAVVVFLGTQAASRGDFEWTKTSGPPNEYSKSMCTVLPACIGTGCVNSSVTVTINGKETKAKSYDRNVLYQHGHCQNNPKGNKCLEYPNAGLRCARLQLYALDDCSTNVALYDVYWGTCDPLE